MQTVAFFTGGRTVEVGWRGLRVGGHPALSLHSPNEPRELTVAFLSLLHHKHYRGIIITA